MRIGRQELSHLRDRREQALFQIYRVHHALLRVFSQREHAVGRTNAVHVLDEHALRRKLHDVRRLSASRKGLPFADATFDLVLARCSASSPREVARILKSGGTVLTLQGRTEWQGETLADALGATPPEWTIPGQGWFVGHSLFAAGFRVERWEKRIGSTTFLDIGAVVYLLLHVPWAIPDFDLERYRERLYRLYLRIRAEGGFTTHGASMLIEARTP